MKREDINTINDYNKVMEGYKVSSAPLGLREKAIKELEDMYPEFNKNAKTQKEKVTKMIAEAAPDSFDVFS